MGIIKYKNFAYSPKSAAFGWLLYGLKIISDLNQIFILFHYLVTK